VETHFLETINYLPESLEPVEGTLDALTLISMLLTLATKDINQHYLLLLTMLPNNSTGLHSS